MKVCTVDLYLNGALVDHAIFESGTSQSTRISGAFTESYAHQDTATSPTSLAGGSHETTMKQSTTSIVHVYSCYSNHGETSQPTSNYQPKAGHRHSRVSPLQPLQECSECYLESSTSMNASPQARKTPQTNVSILRRFSPKPRFPMTNPVQIKYSPFSKEFYFFRSVTVCSNHCLLPLSTLSVTTYPSRRRLNVQTNAHALIRELSGPRPLCRVVDIVPKPLIWNQVNKYCLFLSIVSAPRASDANCTGWHWLRQRFLGGSPAPPTCGLRSTIETVARATLKCPSPRNSPVRLQQRLVDFLIIPFALLHSGKGKLAFSLPPCTLIP